MNLMEKTQPEILNILPFLAQIDHDFIRYQVLRLGPCELPRFRL